MLRQINHAQPEYRLPVFVVLSILAHAVWFVSDQTASIDIPAQDPGQIAIHLNSETKPPKTKPSTQIDDVPTSVSEAKSSTGESSQLAQLNQQQFRSKVLSHINRQLKYTFIYPSIARSKGWQGHVLLGFSINHAGQIGNVRIIRSSGYSVLDDSAIHALTRIKQLELEKTESLFQVHQFEVPIIYRLEG